MLTFKSTQAYNEIDLHGVSNIGINDQNDQGIMIYPNPTTGILEIAGQARNDVRNVEVFDVYGRKVLSHHLITSSSNHLINISHLSSGMYFIQVTTEAGTITKKVIKE